MVNDSACELLRLVDRVGLLIKDANSGGVSSLNLTPINGEAKDIAGSGLRKESTPGY